MFDVYKTLLNAIAEPITEEIAAHDIDLLYGVVARLKGVGQSSEPDAEGWAAGESLERMLRYIVMSVALAEEAKPHVHGNEYVQPRRCLGAQGVVGVGDRLGETMTFRIVIRHIENDWYVSVDVLDNRGQLISHAGGTSSTMDAALDFVACVIGQTEGEIDGEADKV